MPEIYPHPKIHLLHRDWSPFHIFGILGVSLGAALTLYLAWQTNLSPVTMAILAVVAVLTFLVLTMATKIITGEERIINYHHQIAVVLTAAVLLWASGQSVLPYLDLVMVGVGLFIACGRVGCLMTGCCYGRPHRWGVCYRRAHVDEGFPPYLAGVRLFPVQAVEMGWVFAIAAVGTGLILQGYPPGTAFSWHFVAYSAGRFFFEFLRGDPDRPDWKGFSEAQWTAVALVWSIGGAAWLGILPLYSWQPGAAVALTVAMIATALKRDRQPIPTHRLLHPRHIQEVAQALGRIAQQGTQSQPGPGDRKRVVSMAFTSLEIQLSGGSIQTEAKQIQHYTLSSKNGSMSLPVAHFLADLITKLKHPSAASKIVQGQQAGVFHLFIE